MTSENKETILGLAKNLIEKSSTKFITAIKKVELFKDEDNNNAIKAAEEEFEVIKEKFESIKKIGYTKFRVKN